MSHRNQRNRLSADIAKRSCSKEAYVQHEKLTEGEVGITEYISTSDEGFTGILKARYSDFHVNEIDLDGQIAKLTNLEPPQFPEVVISKEKCEAAIEKIFPDCCNQINSMLSDETSEPLKFDITDMSKEDRTDFHENIKTIYKSTVIAQTITENDKRFIKIEKYNKNKESSQRLKWPNNVGDYVHFLVYKECLDTMEACLRISSALNVKPSTLMYAGVKDRRAKTTQWFSIKKYLPERMVHKTKGIRNVKIGNFKFTDQPLKLGQLKGNRFRLALRNVTVDNNIIESHMKSLNDNGFINYFGLQRFGCDKEVPTFAVGIKLLRGQWKEACELILKVKKTDFPRSDTTKAKQAYATTSNAQLALNEFARNRTGSLEYKLLEGLSKNNKNDYVNALSNIPRNSRLLYIHAFQSLVWNQVVSIRIKKFGLKPLIGDLVVIGNVTEDEINLSDSESEEKNEIKGDGNINSRSKVKALTEEELDQYTIFDIVLPLPGYDIVYPENEMKIHYEELLKSYNLSLEMTKQSVKIYNLSGTYRKIMSKVQNLSWKVLHYNEPDDVLIRSDYEELCGEKEPEDQPNGKFKALIMDFCLDSCSYATMVVREVLKTDTNSVAHAKLNDYFKETEKCKEEITQPMDFEKEHDLLSNKEKFEEFKKFVFAVEDDSEPPTKVAKTD